MVAGKKLAIVGGLLLMVIVGVNLPAGRLVSPETANHILEQTPIIVIKVSGQPGPDFYQPIGSMCVVDSTFLGWTAAHVAEVGREHGIGGKLYWGVVGQRTIQGEIAIVGIDKENDTARLRLQPLEGGTMPRSSQLYGKNPIPGQIAAGFRFSLDGTPLLVIANVAGIQGNTIFLSLDSPAPGSSGGCVFVEDEEGTPKVIGMFLSRLSWADNNDEGADVFANRVTLVRNLLPLHKHKKDN